MLRHLLQPHAMTYMGSHPEVFYKIVFSKVLQNSQENSCAEVSFLCSLNKNEGLELAVLLWILRNCFDVKIQKANVCKCCLRKCIYFLCILKSNNKQKLIYYKCCSRFMMWLKTKNIIAQILFIGNLIKFIWIVVLGLQARQEIFALGIRSFDPCVFGSLPQILVSVPWVTDLRSHIK